MTDSSTDTDAQELTDAGELTDAQEFRGWPADGLAFLAELEEDNTRAFWTDNSDRYRVALLEPTRALAGALTEEFGPLRVFRPYIDRRFRPTEAPYRTDTGVTVAGPGGTPYTAVVSPRGLAVQVGYRRFDARQLRRFRAAVDHAAGEDLVAVLAALHGDGLTPDDVPALIGRPRGCPRDHPRLALMRLRGLHVDRRWPAGDWLATVEAMRRIREAWRAARPLADWLDAHVGPRPEPISADDPGRGTGDHEPVHSPAPADADRV